MNEHLTITERISKRKLTFDYGVTLLEVYESFKPELKTLPMNAKVNNITRRLDYRLYRNCTVEFIDYTVDSGMRTYVRTLALILGKAVQELSQNGRKDVIFEHAISNGYYCVWGKGLPAPTPEEVYALKARMQSAIDQDITIQTLRTPIEEAHDFLQSVGRHASAALLSQQGKCYVDMYEVDGYRDVIFGSVLPRTGMLSTFDVVPYEKGVLLLPPNVDDISKPNTLIPQPKAFKAFDSHLDLLKSLGVEDIAPLNARIHAGKAAELITIAEALQEKQIAGIAEEITRRHAEGVRIVLVAGPSSSGKTTFSKRLHTQLQINLIKPYALSLDDFFLDRELTPKDEKGDYDFESLYALDLSYLQETLGHILSGQKVAIPSFDFVLGTRVFKGQEIELKDGEILIIEGIHGLNPDLLQGIPESSIFRVYVSALTSLSMDEHNWISTSDNRLLRRMVRDAKYRGAPATKSLSMWADVRRGERKWIFPYQENADVMFNSAMLYEIAALKVQAEPLLHQIKENDPCYSEAHRLLRFLQFFEPIPLSLMPPTSLLCEFLGGSSFTY
ncbi:nucleoside kinase [Porphyromonas sp.]|uniref:nucleoside kinase n=1 Tax=Porphyromonas sp. TaxID=1924944 RepID=UPI0026DD626A|nr:nucleoside kinase [Porphyromonas sp.]MDO4770433.1 nucleoside kinase [Porphyromonas sp.]